MDLPSISVQSSSRPSEIHMTKIPHPTGQTNSPSFEKNLHQEYNQSDRGDRVTCGKQKPLLK